MAYLIWDDVIGYGLWDITYCPTASVHSSDFTKLINRSRALNQRDLRLCK